MQNMIDKKVQRGGSAGWVLEFERGRGGRRVRLSFFVTFGMLLFPFLGGKVG